jgi:hypothetical protein
MGRTVKLYAWPRPATSGPLRAQRARDREWRHRQVPTRSALARSAPARSEIAYLMGEATPEEKREAMEQFGKRANASPDREFWTCGVPDEDEDP